MAITTFPINTIVVNPQDVFDAAANAQAAAAEVSSALVAKADAINFEPLGGRIPLIASDKKVLLWLEADGRLKTAYTIPEDAPTAPRICSDARSLTRCKIKSALVRANPGGTDRLRIAVMGDSWADLATIPAALRTLMSTTIGLAGEGWNSVMGNTQIGGVTFAKANWTVLDASAGVSSWPLGVGADGHLITTTTATSTITIGNLVATEMRIYSFQNSGTWRYRVDGGSWNTVVEAGDNSLRTTIISGLPSVAHTLEIDTAGNTGTVSIAGFYSTRAGAGVEVLKMGNASLDASHLLTYAPMITSQIADLMPDVLICFLGTNDSRRAGKTPEGYILGIASLAAAARAAIPDIGLIFVAPSQASTVGLVRPILEYSDALDAWCADNGAEFLSLSRQMGAYAQTNLLGIWADTVHHNGIGAAIITSAINDAFLKI